MPKGDLVLIPFPFTDLTGNKLRPALILAETLLDVTVAFITTQLHWQEQTDIVLTPQTNKGIKKHSLVRLSKIATIDNSLILGSIGSINTTQIHELDRKLKMIFQIP